jgi:hypothetical protein
LGFKSEPEFSNRVFEYFKTFSCQFHTSFVLDFQFMTTSINKFPIRQCLSNSARYWSIVFLCYCMLSIVEAIREVAKRRFTTRMQPFLSLISGEHYKF